MSTKIEDKDTKAEIIDENTKTAEIVKSEAENAYLMLITDLSVTIPERSSVSFHFQATSGYLIGILIDNRSSLEIISSFEYQVKSLESGYHLIRAVLLDSVTKLCIKSPAAYIEAEFFVGTPIPCTRKFMFGQPSVFIVSPRKQVKESTLVVDFFLTNCELSDMGYAVRIYLNNKVVETYAVWKPISIDIGTIGEKFDLKLCLVRPSGKEIKMPEYNYTNLAILKELSN